MADASIDAGVFWGASSYFRVEFCKVMYASNLPVLVSVVVMMPSVLYTALVTAAYMAFSLVT
jgi:hypothetical protein